MFCISTCTRTVGHPFGRSQKAKVMVLRVAHVPWSGWKHCQTLNKLIWKLFLIDVKKEQPFSEGTSSSCSSPNRFASSAFSSCDFLWDFHVHSEDRAERVWFSPVSTGTTTPDSAKNTPTRCDHVFWVRQSPTQRFCACLMFSFLTNILVTLKYFKCQMLIHFQGFWDGFSTSCDLSLPPARQLATFWVLQASWFPKPLKIPAPTPCLYGGWPSMDCTSSVVSICKAEEHQPTSMMPCYPTSVQMESPSEFRLGHGFWLIPLTFCRFWRFFFWGSHHFYWPSDNFFHWISPRGCTSTASGREVLRRAFIGGPPNDCRVPTWWAWWSWRTKADLHESSYGNDGVLGLG